MEGRIQEWKRTIESNPGKFCELEHTIHEEYRNGTDMVLAALLVMVHSLASFDAAAEASRAKSQRKAGLATGTKTKFTRPSAQHFRLINENTGFKVRNLELHPFGNAFYYRLTGSDW